MVKANRVLAIAVLALALVFPVAQSFSDEASDIEAVDRELEAEDMAFELYKRALDRANKAVAASSLGKKAERLWDEFSAATEAFEKTRAYREYLGSDKLPVYSFSTYFPTYRRLDEESNEEYWQRLYGSAGRERYHEEKDARHERYVETRRSFRIKEIVEERDTADFRMNALRKKMVLKFLMDEINKAVEQALYGLERELRDIHARAAQDV